MSFVYFWLKGISQTGHFSLIRSFSPSISKCNRGIESITYISQKVFHGLYAIIPFQYWEKRNVQKILMYYYLPTLLQYNIAHTSIIIIHYVLHTIRIFYQTLCSYIKFSGPCTKYKFIVAVISPFFIWMTIFERSMKNVVCPWPIMNLTHGLIYPA